MSASGIQGRLLEVTVVGCNKLKDTEWISRQDPYVILEYGGNKFRTRTHTDGGKNPVFQEKFNISLIEGLRELNVVVYNSNTITHDDYIGSGKIQLQKVLCQGFDDTTWPIQTKTGRYAGEVRLILHYSNANKPASNYAPSAPPYAGQPVFQASYSMPPPPPAPVSTTSYPPPAMSYPAPSPYPSYLPVGATTYPPSPYPPPQSSVYPPPVYPPPSAYSPSPYPPPPQGSSYYPPGPFPGLYPPPPY